MCIPSAVYGQELSPAIFLNKSIIETDVPPQIIEDRTMVPIRLIAESLNYEVEWKAQDELSPKVLIKNKDASIELTIDSDQALVKNEKIENIYYLDSPPQVLQNRTLVPVRFIAEVFGQTVNWDNDAKIVIIGDLDEYQSFMKDEKNSLQYYRGKIVDEIPVFMIHEVVHEVSNTIHPDNYILYSNLEAMVQYLHTNGYHMLGMNELYDFYTTRGGFPEKSVALTFDDGYASHLTYVKDLLNKYNAKGTFYIIKAGMDLGIENRNLENLRKLIKSGQQVGNHTLNHVLLGQKTYDEAYGEIGFCQYYLRDEAGAQGSHIAYPFGSYNESTLQIAKELGYQTGVTVKPEFLM